MASFQERFHAIMVESFGEYARQYNENTDLYTLGHAHAVDDFFDELESAFSDTLEQEQRQQIRYVGQAWAWAWQAAERQAAEEAEERAVEEAEHARPQSLDQSSPFDWQERIWPLQRILLKVFYIAGLATFGCGIYIAVNPKHAYAKWGSLLMGLGMFVAVQMYWGMQSFFNWLEKRNSSMLQKLGYPTVFWLAVVVALVVDYVAVDLLKDYVMGALTKK